MRSRLLRSGFVLAACLLVGLSSLSCGGDEAPPAPPPPTVQVMHPVVRELTSYGYYNGITRGLEESEVRPEVAGYLDEIKFRPDSQVKAGDELFVIDQRTYKIAVDRAEAELTGKRATVEKAQANLDRVKTLYSRGAASEQELIDRQAEYDLAVSEVSVAKAELAQATKNLDDTVVRAEISGRISRNRVDRGTLLRVNEPVLATIVNDNNIYVDFQVSEAEFLEYIRKHPLSRTEDADEMPPVVVELGMADQTGYPHPGRVVYGANKVDPSTASYEVTALFDNPDKQIASGLYVRLRAIMGTGQALLVPDVAVQADARGAFVYVVEKNKDGVDVAVRRSVEVSLGPPNGQYRRVMSGVTQDDRVIFNGLMMVRPEIPVTPVMTDPPPLPPTTLPTTLP